jgi:hemolysin activation/secretion protein
VKHKQINYFYIPLVSVSIGAWLLLMPCGISHAQTPQLPGSADPARLQERLVIPQTDLTQDIIVPEDMVIDSDIPQNPDGFVLQGVKLHGVTVFEDNHFDELITEYVGLPVDINTLNHLAARIIKTYRDAGYFLSRAVVPQQEVTEGNVIIKVIEGRVGKVILDDNAALLKKDKLGIVAKTIRKIETLNPLHGPTLERYVLLLNDHMGITIQNILQAPQQPHEAGSVDVVLRVLASAKQQVSLAYNNHGSRFVGPHQITGTYQRGGLFHSFDRLSVQGTTSLPMSEVQLGSMSYGFPLNEEGLTASFSASYSNSEPGLSLRDLEVEGDSTTLSASLTYPLIRSRKTSLIAGASFEVRNSATEFLDEELIDDKTRSFSIFANYNTQDQWNGISDVSLSLSKGMDIFAVTETGEGNLSREQGRSDFIKVELNASRQQDLGEVFQMINSVSAQYAPHPLLSSQEFGYGGTGFGRAYDPSEITGDQGVAAAIEILYTNVETIPDLHLKLVPFAFYDIGKVWNEDRGSKRISGASAGFGAYYNFNNRVNGQLHFAYPLTKSVSTPIMNGDNSPRILLSLNTSF